VDLPISRAIGSVSVKRLILTKTSLNLNKKNELLICEKKKDTLSWEKLSLISKFISGGGDRKPSGRETSQLREGPNLFRGDKDRSEVDRDASREIDRPQVRYGGETTKPRKQIHLGVRKSTLTR